MPKQTITIRQSLEDNTLKILEDGQLDLALLGKVLSRRRVGLISPSPEDPAKFEVAMLDEEGNKKVLPGRYALKADAVAAEVEEAKKTFLQKDQPPQKKEGGQEGKGMASPPCTGNQIAKCPSCRGQIYPAIILVRQAGVKTSKAVFKCTQECPLNPRG